MKGSSYRQQCAHFLSRLLTTTITLQQTFLVYICVSMGGECVHVCVSMGACECVGMWVCGYVGVRVCGYVGLSMYTCACVGVQCCVGVVVVVYADMGEHECVCVFCCWNFCKSS